MTFILLPGEDDWNVVIIKCKSLAADWEKLSGYLGLFKRDIDKIKRDHPNDNCICWNEALSEWIKRNYNVKKFGIPSWRTLLKAVELVDKCKSTLLASEFQGNSYLVMLWILLEL